MRSALVIGVAQALALIPGTSRSGVTMTAAYLRRVEFRRCRMSGLSAPNLRAHHVRFTDCRAVLFPRFHTSLFPVFRRPLREHQATCAEAN